MNLVNFVPLTMFDQMLTVVINAVRFNHLVVTASMLTGIIVTAMIVTEVPSFNSHFKFSIEFLN